MVEKAGPNMRKYGRQLFICNHGDCAPAEEAEGLGSPAAVVLPGSKATLADRAYDRLADAVEEAVDWAAVDALITQACGRCR